MVADAIGQILPFAVGVAISPVPIIGVILMLATPQARSNGPAFIFGWVAGLAIVGTVVLLVASGADASDQGQPADWVSVLKLVARPAAPARRRQAVARAPPGRAGSADAEVDADDRRLHRRQGTGAPVALYFALGARSKPILDDLKDWMSHNNAAIMAVLCLVIGAKLIGDAISGLAA